MSKALDRLNAEIELEDAMAKASEQMEIGELLSRETPDFDRGFSAGYNFRLEHEATRAEDIQQKRNKFNITSIFRPTECELE